MGVYNIDEGVLGLPGSWTDRTINVLGHPASDGSNFSLVLTRAELSAGQSIEAFADQQLQEHAQTLRGFEYGKRSRMVGNLPSVEAKNPLGQRHARDVPPLGLCCLLWPRPGLHGVELREERRGVREVGPVGAVDRQVQGEVSHAAGELTRRGIRSSTRRSSSAA